MKKKIEKKDHLWIPNSEVRKLDKKLTARSKNRGIQHFEHGKKLSENLQIISKIIENTKEESSLSNSKVLVFKVKLFEGEKIKDKKDLFLSTGLEVKVVKTENNAVVTTTEERFKFLKKKLKNYSNDGSGKTYFDQIEEFDSYTGNEKNSKSLQKKIILKEIPKTLDIQLMFLPNLDKEDYIIATDNFKEKVRKKGGEIQGEPYYLSDNTPIFRVIIPSSTLSCYENDNAIYRIEETDFFGYNIEKASKLDLKDMEISEDVSLETLPIVTVLDTGIKFPDKLKPLIYDSWAPNELDKGDEDHGTMVASRVVFKYISNQIKNNKIIPRARVIDCNIINGRTSTVEMIQRVQRAVEKFYNTSKIYNLSANSSNPIEGDEMSIFGYELDVLQLKYNVQFVVSSGNHNLWESETSLEDILDDDDSRISSPADSMLAIVVGAVTGKDHENSLTKTNEITTYSRRGPGFNGFSKPDIAAYGGVIINSLEKIFTPYDDYSVLLNKNGELITDSGTSFTAPIVAGDLAEILNIIPEKNLLLSKALLYHNSKPLWDEKKLSDEELMHNHNLYGRGISSVDDSKYSSPSKVTFVRTGTLNRLEKERINIYMPKILAEKEGMNKAKVSVTCLTMSSVDRTKGTEYLGAYVRASLKKTGENGNLISVQKNFKEK